MAFFKIVKLFNVLFCGAFEFEVVHVMYVTLGSGCMDCVIYFWLFASDINVVAEVKVVVFHVRCVLTCSPKLV
jgi:hypothetical protein